VPLKAVAQLRKLEGVGDEAGREPIDAERPPSRWDRDPTVSGPERNALAEAR